MTNSNLSQLTESLGEFVEYWGFKPIHGKVWVYIFLRNEPVSTRELQDEFKISKALLSTVVNTLKDYKVILDAGKGKYGVELFTANTDIMQGILNVVRSREKNIVSGIHVSLKQLKEIPQDQLKNIGIDYKRLITLEKLVSLALKAVNSILKLEDIRFSKWKVFRSIRH